MIYSKKLNVELNKQGIQGKQGAKGAQGEQGPQGPKGDTGAKGADGKNAIVMTSATTPNGEYNGQIGIWQGQLYQWNDSNWVLTSGVLPTDPVIHYSFDDDINVYTPVKIDNGSLSVDNNTGTVTLENGNNLFINFTKETLNMCQIAFSIYGLTTGTILSLEIETNIASYANVVYYSGGSYINDGVLDLTQKRLFYKYNGNNSRIILQIYAGKTGHYCNLKNISFVNPKNEPIINNVDGKNNGVNNGGISVKGVNSNAFRLYKNSIAEAYFTTPQNFSVSIWCKPENNRAGMLQNIIVSNSFIIRNGITWGSYLMAYCFTQLEDGSYDSTIVRSPTIALLDPNKFTHIVLTKNKNILKLYIDGKLEVTQTRYSEIMQKSDVLYFGNIYNGRNQDLDDFQIFDRPLSDQEVLGLYLARGNTPKRYTMADYQNSINGGKYHSTTKPTMAFEGDYYLNTTDGYIYSYDGTTWVKITDYNDARYKIAMTDMINLAATNPNVPFIAVTNAWIKNLAAGNILANEIATKELKLTGDGVIKSENYNTGISGFKIFSNGDAEFNNGVIKTPELNFAGVKGLEDNLLKNGYRLKPIFNDWGQGYFGEEPVYRCAGYDSDGKVVALYLGCSYELSFSGTLNIYLAKNEHIYCSEICKSVNFRTVISDVSADNVSPYPIIGSSVRNVLAFTNTSSKFWSANVADKIFSVSVKAGQYITCFVEALLSAPAENVGTIYSKSIENSGTSNAYKESALYIKKENKIAKDLLKGNEKVFNESIFLTRGTGVYDVRGVGSFGNYFIIGNVLVQWGQTMSYTVPSGQYFIETINLPIAYNDAGDVVGNATGLDGYSVIMSSSTKNNGGGMEYAEIWERRTNSSFTVRTYNRNESTTIESWSLRWMTIGYLN